MHIEETIREFKSLVGKTSAKQHPWFAGIREGEFTEEQIILGELQHYLRNRLNALAQTAIVTKATEEGNERLIAAAIENFKEEVGGKKTHGDLMFQFLEEHGVSKTKAMTTEPMPGTMAAISMLIYGLRTFPSAIERLAVWSLAEWENGGKNGVAASVYKAYRDTYKFSHYASETYKVHSVVDVTHGESQLRLLAEIVCEQPELKNRVLRAMKYGHAGFNFEWDGHFQALSGQRNFHWQGL